MHQLLQHQIARAVHHHFAVVHHDNAVNDLQNLRAVGYHHHGFVFAPLRHSIQSHAFGGLIQAGGGLVQQHHFGVAQSHARQGNNLFLAARQAQAIFAQGHIEAARVVADDAVEAEAL